MKTITKWMISVLVLAVALSGCALLPVVRSEEEAPGWVTEEDLAPVESVEVMILESFPVQVRLLVAGNLPDGCTELDDWTVTRDDDTFSVTLPTTRTEDAMCTQALVPYEVTIPLDVAGLAAGTYTVDVNGVTAQFTLDVDNVLPEEPVGETLPAAESARLALSQALGTTDIEIVSTEPVEWPNACLGAADADEMCAEVITPGYIVTLAVDDAVYVYHTDATGDSVRLVTAPDALAAPVLS
jgi:inhibitor of cysteine peptidase